MGTKMKRIQFIMMGIAGILLLAGCPSPTDSTADGSTADNSTVVQVATEGSGFYNVTNIGDTGVLTLNESSQTLTMIYANDSNSITFPTGIDDSGTSTLTTKFWMAETEATNGVVAAVFQWAYDNSRFSVNVGDPNGLDITIAKHGGQLLLDLADPDCRVDYDGSGNFAAESGYENNPVTNTNWYGAVMFCNWLTEMRDGNTANLVYTSIDTDWVDNETVEDTTKTGYRLPSSAEWEYAARYRGTDATNTVSGYNNPYFTQGNSASGAAADYNNLSACDAVAVYNDFSLSPPDDEAAVKSLGAGSANALGLYDMSGNVWEWCFTEEISRRIVRGGSWRDAASWLQVGTWANRITDREYNSVGFRFCRTAD
jgi:sulfatase modifying factor 1